MLLHPPVVHFAIVLPVVASLFGLIYLFKRDERWSKYSSRATLIAALAIIAAWYTGSKAGPEIYAFLSEGGKEELLEHKALGAYLAIAFGAIALLKMLGCKMKQFAVEAIAVLLLLGATAVTFAQGKDGGEIVYEYGKPFTYDVMAPVLKDAKSTAEDEDDDEAVIEAYEDGIDEAFSAADEVFEKLGIEVEEDDGEEGDD